MPRIIRLPRLIDRSKTTKKETKETLTASNKIKAMTVKELKKYISQGVKSINNALKQEKREGVVYNAFNKAVVMFGGERTKGGMVKVGAAGLKKKELIKRAAAVSKILYTDTESEEAEKRKQERLVQAYNSYKERHGGSDLTLVQYEELVNVYGDLSNLLFEYGYEDEEVKETVMQALEEGIKKGLTKREIEALLITHRSTVKQLPTAKARAAYLVRIIQQAAEEKAGGLV